MLQLLLSEGIENIALILAVVNSLFQKIASAFLVIFSNCIMSRNNIIKAELLCFFQQLIKLDVAVTVDARIRRSAVAVSVNKALDNVASEIIGIVKNVIINAEMLTRNATREARATLDQSIAQFNATVLKAMQEVENAISGYRNSIKQIVALRQTVNQNEETLRLSVDLYKQGLTTFQNVLDAQRTLLSYRNSLVQAQGVSILSLIQLYTALGGGW